MLLTCLVVEDQKKKKTTQEQDESIVQAHTDNLFLPAAQTARDFGVSKDTVIRRLKSAGFKCRRPYIGPFLSDHHRQARLNWSISHSRWYLPKWDTVLFSDESKFNLFFADGRQRVWRKDGERYSEGYVLETDRFGGGGIMVWAGISSFHRTDLIVLNGGITGQAYVDNVLKTAVVPFF